MSDGLKRRDNFLWVKHYIRMKALEKEIVKARNLRWTFEPINGPSVRRASSSLVSNKQPHQVSL
jgi:hypothetical protein